jgi:hypothetical protein
LELKALRYLSKSAKFLIVLLRESSRTSQSISKQLPASAFDDDLVLLVKVKQVSSSNSKGFRV